MRNFMKRFSAAFFLLMFFAALGSEGALMTAQHAQVISGLGNPQKIAVLFFPIDDSD